MNGASKRANVRANGPITLRVDFIIILPTVCPPLPASPSVSLISITSFGSSSPLQILENISLFVRRGSCVAVVGDKVSGKTTLLRLLARMYHPTEGRILLDGEDLRSMGASPATVVQGLEKVEPGTILEIIL